MGEILYAIRAPDQPISASRSTPTRIWESASYYEVKFSGPSKPDTARSETEAPIGCLARGGAPDAGPPQRWFAWWLRDRQPGGQGHAAERYGRDR